MQHHLLLEYIHLPVFEIQTQLFVKKSGTYISKLPHAYKYGMEKQLIN